MNVDHRRIELVWPGKDSNQTIRQRDDGGWDLVDDDGPAVVLPLVDLQVYPGDVVVPRSIAVGGDRLDALRTLARGLAGTVKLAYLDLPRIEVDDQRAAFHGDPVRVWSSWLSVVRAHIVAIKPLMRRDGFVALHCGTSEEAYLRALADEELYRDNLVATIVWQRSYAPRNALEKEFTATHDPIVVYAIDKSSAPSVGILTGQTGFTNPDDDPRGPWRANHKGARSKRPNSDFETHVPPYSWRLASGRLPSGLWRLSPLTGVIWGTPNETGDFPIVVEVSDVAGQVAQRELTIRVTEREHASAAPTLVPWLLDGPCQDGPLRISTDKLPVGAVGHEYRALVEARGGTPRTGTNRPKSGRYWEFALNTLIDAYRRDAVYLGRDGRAIPHPKQYERTMPAVRILKQVTWWPARAITAGKTEAFCGFTQDATKWSPA